MNEQNAQKDSELRAAYTYFPACGIRLMSTRDIVSKLRQRVLSLEKTELQGLSGDYIQHRLDRHTDQ
jgi:hypothetical protein